MIPKARHFVRMRPAVQAQRSAPLCLVILTIQLPPFSEPLPERIDWRKFIYHLPFHSPSHEQNFPTPCKFPLPFIDYLQPNTRSRLFFSTLCFTQNGSISTMRIVLFMPINLFFNCFISICMHLLNCCFLTIFALLLQGWWREY